MAKERPYHPSLTLRRVANGWIVEPFCEPHLCRSLDEVHVFRNWSEAEEYMLATTTPQGAP